MLFGHHAQAQDWANKARYAKANMELLSHEADPQRVVLLGNSITEGWKDAHPQFFTINHLVGRGISGQVSSQMLARFRQDVINLKPQIVVINCGTNDIAENNGPYDEDITMDNIVSMSELALANGIQVVLSSVLPTDHFIWNPDVEQIVEKIHHLNQRIIEYCNSRHIPYLDYYTSMTNNSASMIEAYTDDGVHPNSAGYDVMEAKLKEMFETLNQYYNNQ
jgi:lysophospholipase L1-like esterase